MSPLGELDDFGLITNHTLLAEGGENALSKARRPAKMQRERSSLHGLPPIGEMKENA